MGVTMDSNVKQDRRRTMMLNDPLPSVIMRMAIPTMKMSHPVSPSLYSMNMNPT